MMETSIQPYPHSVHVRPLSPPQLWDLASRTAEKAAVLSDRASFRSSCGAEEYHFLTLAFKSLQSTV